MSKSDLISAIREEESYKKFKKIVLVARGRIDAERDKAEALASHASRVSRRMYGQKQFSPKSLMEASSQDMSIRSRLVEIRVQCSLTTSMLDAAIDGMRGYISTEYSDDLKVFKTIGDRKAFLDRIVKGALDLMAEGSTVVDLIDTLVKDIDATSHQLRQMVECLKLLDQSKGGRVV